ncbi:L,D-transpeptidase [Lacunisphaera limnophila]|uniref:L,D-transpeptidase n=1 Tax=Lacunisphaera limnophila TaxID=1838286 RepID=UPI00214F6E01|nr:L,D-transpeptidase [Lacunisphaera limnophila]
MNEGLERIKEKCHALGLKPTTRLITVSIARQLLGFYRDGCLVRSHVISTSLRPPSNVKDSLGTPRGLHEIAEKVGAGQPPGIVFKARVATGQHYSELSAAEQARNLITTRILWLRGLEPGHNAGTAATGEVVDTYARYVYIHGTNHEERLGRPFSGGCIEMNNLEILALFDEIRPRDQVWIED